MPIRQVGTQRKKPAPRVAQPEETPREGSGCKAGPQQNLGKARARDSPGTGRGFQAPPPRKSGPPRALEIPRAPRNAARLPGNQEKNFCFFFFLFWHSPPAPSSWLSPPRGTPLRGAPPPTNRLCGFVTGKATTAEDTPRIFQSIKGGAGGRGLRSLKPGTAPVRVPPPGLLLPTTLPFFSAFSREEFAAFRRSGTGAPAPWEGSGLSGLGFYIFSLETVVELLSTVDYNCNMTLEELVACDNAAQK